MSYVSYLRFELPHLDAHQLTFRIGPLSAPLWVGFTRSGESESVSRYVGLVIALSEGSALRRAQKAYRRWHQMYGISSLS